MDNSTEERDLNDFETANLDLERQLGNLSDEELRWIAEDIHSSVLEVGKALEIIFRRRELSGYKKDRFPVDYIK